MVTTQDEALNKPSVAIAKDGINWVPNKGGPSADITVVGYPNWDTADVNGGNVIFYDSGDNSFHFFFH